MSGQYGLRVRRNGLVTLDSSRGVPRYLGTRLVTSDGQLTDSRLLSGRTWYYLVPLTDPSQNARPSISISGATLAWSGITTSTRIMYGVY